MTHDERMTIIHWKLHKFAYLIGQHIADVLPEKGLWDGEDPLERVWQIQNRLDRIVLLRVQPEYATPNDDGSPRTMEGETIKLGSSVFILFDLLGLLGDVKLSDPE